MALQDLPNGFYTPTRQQLIDQYQRDVKIRQPGALTGTGTKALFDGTLLADLLLPLYADAASAARNADMDAMTFSGLQIEAASIGIPSLLPATGGAGAIILQASGGGTNLLENDEIKDDATGLRFRVVQTGLYTDQQPVQIVGFDTGPATNLAPGTLMKWTVQRAGCGAKALIAAQSDGITGLKGGRDAETQGELKDRIRDAHANPAAAGNEGQYRLFVTATPGIGVQEVFCFAAINGPGTVAYVFTMRPSTPGATRAPTAGQIAFVYAYLVGQLPKDDSIFPLILIEVPLTVVLNVTWQSTSAGWMDQTTWPTFEAPLAKVTAVTDSTHFTVTSIAAPIIHANFAFYSAALGKYFRKNVLTATNLGGNSWAIVCDTSNGVSDTSYIPSVNEPFCPWSDSLQDLAPPVLVEFGKLGPGEQRGPFFDAGLRWRRSPSPNVSWPSSLTARAFGGIYAIPSVADFQVQSPTFPSVCPVGIPGISVNVQTLGRLLAWPLAG